MRHQIYDAVFQHRQARDPGSFVEFCGHGRFGAVSALATEAVGAATQATLEFCDDVLGSRPEAVVDRASVDQWCQASFRPEGWKPAPLWNAFSKDYQTRDGWVRLHCNAAHHRQAALSVLGRASTPEQAGAEALKWHAERLVQAIAEAGGCASALSTAQQWRSHPQGQAIAQEPIVAWDRRMDCPSRWSAGTRARPLSGLRVLDLTRVIAGPVATRFLASLGADVLRIDPPFWSEGGSEIEMTVGKTCAGLDLTRPEDRTQFNALLKTAHVLVHGYRQDALGRLGYTSDALAELNPSLIMVGLTAYGWTGPWANRRGFDSLVQRSTGLAVLQQEAVVDLPYQVLDHATGYLMAAAALDALRLQQTKGIASRARLSLARQAMVLLDSGVNAGNVQRLEMTDGTAAAQLGTKEDTAWGPGWRRPLPYDITGVALGWDKPAQKLRQDRPAWRSTATGE